jgi:LysM repeat protein
MALVRLPRILRAIAVELILVVVLLAVGLAVHVYRTQPRPARTLVERELRGGLLAPDEHLERIATVFRRRPSDYFRATRGILALTDKRIVYVGVAPRDILGPNESAPAFESRDFALDTSTTVAAGHALLGAVHAIVIRQDGERNAFGVSDADWVDGRAIIGAVHAHQETQRAEAARNRRAHEVADSIARAPKWHVVARGEALSTIATMYNTTPEKLRELNSLTSDKIRVGQRLLVKPQT